MYEALVQEWPLRPVTAMIDIFVSPTGYLDIITLDRVKVEDSFKRGHLDTATNSLGSEGLEGMSLHNRMLQKVFAFS